MTSFKQLTDSLQFWAPAAPSTDLTYDELRNECRDYIRDSGFECLDGVLDEDTEAADYISEHHPDWDTSGFRWHSVLNHALDFYCADGCGDLCDCEVRISFYGDWEKQTGVFNVTD